MKITAIRLFKLVGHSSAEWTGGEARTAAPLDVYEEFRLRGPADRPGPDGPVKIASIYVEIATDEGAGGLYGPILTEQAFVIASKLRPFLMGRDPLTVETLWDQMARLDRHARSGHMMMAISAVDCALWDLRGRHFGVPVYRLLGGPTRERIPVYASMLGFSLQPERVRERAKAFTDRGFTAQKWFFRHGPGSGAAGREANLQLLASLGDALGPSAELMLDCWMSWDLPYAIEMAREILPFGLAWLEEPLPPGHLEGYVRLKRETGIPLAAGEHLYTRWGVKPFLDAGVLNVLQADPDWTGGITELVKICSLAETYDVRVIPHGHNLHAALHVIASRPPHLCPMAEYLIKHLARQQFFLADPIEPIDGRIDLPTAPGLGIAFDDSKIEQRCELQW